MRIEMEKKDNLLKDKDNQIIKLNKVMTGVNK